MSAQQDQNAALTRVRQFQWLLLFRITVILIFLGGTFLFYFREGLLWTSPHLFPLYGLALFSFIHALLSSVFLRRTRRFRLFVQLQVVWDIVFVAFLIHFSGGINSFFSFAYILLIVSYSFFLDRRELLLCASGASILYGSMLDLQYYGYLDFLQVPPAGPIPLSEVVYAVFLNVSAYYITALLGGALVSRLNRSERALEKKVIDYKELERLNRSILYSISSGLMLINSAGRIRLLNAAAERITGYQLKEVYDTLLIDLFPEFEAFDGGFKLVKRGECRILSKGRQEIWLGYNSTLIKHPGEGHLSLLITFQDLTELKLSEERLQQSARMVAVGQLAAGLAHEIRNPLASISGTIQLLLENRSIPEKDTRLMALTMREVRRLNTLLTDFLVYARPSPLRRSAVSGEQIVESLLLLVDADERFKEIKIDCSSVSQESFSLDKEKVCQALWNLLLNAAAALHYRGTISITFDPGKAQIRVEDNGPGVPPELKQRIFEPFFTTKDAGTGLGLATVFTIMQAHHGQITVADRPGGGTSMIMEF
ncbi:MAG: PAS domain S-box protein [Desulfuromonadaceae bacterium]|nr:PAS domain S-box protein [Desulfuromonadaceae bacterium]